MANRDTAVTAAGRLLIEAGEFETNGRDVVVGACAAGHPC
jgi:hypothetical protein